MPKQPKGGNDSANQGRGDYLEQWSHIEAVSVIHSTQDYIIYIDTDNEVNWETTRRYDNSLDSKPEYSLAALNEIINEGVVLEGKVDSGFGDAIKRQVKRLICEAIACALEFDYAGGRRMINEARNCLTASESQNPKKDTSKFARREWESVAVFAFGVVFILLLLGLAIFFPVPTDFQYFVFRTVIALAAAGIAAPVPGLLNINIPGISAGGALAVLVLVFKFSPASLVAQAPPSAPKGEVEKPTIAAPAPPQPGSAAPQSPVVVVIKICSGEYERNCSSHDVYQYCGLSADDWARSRCASFKVQRLDSRDGNKCGYTLDQVICTSPK